MITLLLLAIVVIPLALAFGPSYARAPTGAWKCHPRMLTAFIAT